MMGAKMNVESSSDQAGWLTICAVRYLCTYIALMLHCIESSSPYFSFYCMALYGIELYWNFISILFFPFLLFLFLLCFITFLSIPFYYSHLISIFWLICFEILWFLSFRTPSLSFIMLRYHWVPLRSLSVTHSTSSFHSPSTPSSPFTVTCHS